MKTERADRIQKVTDEALLQLTKDLEVGKSDALKAWLTAMSRFHRYSWQNVLLIAFQKPDATYVAGFHAWRTVSNRFVKKGEKGIMIMAPVIEKIERKERSLDNAARDSDEIRRVVNVKPVYVFDVSQTEGEPLPEFARVTGDPTRCMEGLKEDIAARGIELQYVENLGGASGMSFGGKIQLLAGQEPAEEFSVLVHELAHELLHFGERKGTISKKVRETEAEAVAFVVCKAIGLETTTASSDYIQLYSGDKETLAESLQCIRKVSADILLALESAEKTQPA